MLEDLDILEACLRKERALIVGAEAGGAEELHDRAQNVVTRAGFVDLGDDEQCAARFQHAEDFLHIVGKIGPVVLRFDGGGEIEFVVAERELRDGGLLDFDAAGLDGIGVCLAGHGDAAFGVVDAINLPLRSLRGKLLNGAAAAAADVENCEVWVDFRVFQPPIGELRVRRVHQPDERAA